MAPAGSVFSQTLQSITDAKLEELTKKRAVFEDKKANLIDALKEAPSDLEKLELLLDGVKGCFAVGVSNVKGSKGRIISGSTKDPAFELKLKNLERFLDQTRYDPSLSPALIHEWRDWLIQQLEVQTSKYRFASLYGGLVTEWLASEKASTANEDAEMSDGFEDVGNAEKLESRAEWEKAVFQPHETDQKSITAYLAKLFGKTGANKQAAKALKQLHKSVESFETDMAKAEPFDQYVLAWVIRGLQASDLLSDEKRAVLKDFNNNSVVLCEIADVLNMRMAALENWSWGDEVPVEQRRRVTGSYNIYMHEDLLQAIFLQYMGVKWSVFFKEAFKSFQKYDGAWSPLRKATPKLDKKRRDYFLGQTSKAGSVQTIRQRMYKRDYFMFQLLDSEDQEIHVDEGDEEAEYAPAVQASQQLPRRTMQTARKSMPAPQTPMLARRSGQSNGGAMRHRKVMRDDLIDYSDEEQDDGDEYNPDAPKNPMKLKQKLLHLLSTEIILNKRLHGELTCVRTEFDNWNPSLPHSTIYAVLSFLGVSDKWLTFFKKFMEAPLKFIGDSTKPQIRRRGVPGSHTLSDVLGEVILFCLDYGVNQATDGQQLYRMYDDCWFWSSDQKACVKAWSATTTFTSVMGLKLNTDKTGTVRVTKSGSSLTIDSSLPKGEIRWGFLVLSPTSGRFEIDQSTVDHHITELSHQLTDKESSIFAWVQAWNTYAATFFTTNFGKAANCFGQAHVDNMLATHRRIQSSIFEDNESASGSVVSYLKHQIEQRYNITDIPDGYFHFPAALGGLEIANPFIPLLRIRDAVPAQPESLLDAFEEKEREAYRGAKKAFEDEAVWRGGLDDPGFEPKDKDEFFGFEEFVRYREEFDYGYEGQLRDVFERLLQSPGEEGVECSAEVMTGLNQMAKTEATGTCGINGAWVGMDGYWKWVAQCYGPGVIARFGGLNVVDAGLLPIGMVGLVRSGRVKWRG